MQKEGSQAFLYRGNFVRCMSGVPFSSLEFFFYDLAKNNMFPGIERHELTLWHKFICGGMAGWVAQIMLNPIGVIRSLYRVEQHRQVSSSTPRMDFSHSYTQKIISPNGAHGYYNGFLVPMACVFPLIALQQTSFDYLRNDLLEKHLKTYSDQK